MINEINTLVEDQSLQAFTLIKQKGKCFQRGLSEFTVRSHHYASMRYVRSGKPSGLSEALS